MGEPKVASHSVVFKVVVDCKDEKASNNVLLRIEGLLEREALGVRIEALHDSGHVIHFGVELMSTTWETAVFESLVLGQRLGYGWTLTGDIETDLCGYSSKARISGVTQIELFLEWI